MPVNDEVHNYMEILVDRLLKEASYSENYDKSFLADLSCITLNQLKPLYIRYDVDLLSGSSYERLDALTQQTQIALERSLKLIQRRSHEREENLSVI